MVAAKDYDRDIIKIGRLASAHLCLDDDKVSRIHSVIEVAPDGKLSIIDMGSVEGTWVNGKHVNEGALSFGEEIRIGNTLIKVEDGASARAAAALGVAAQAPVPAVAPVHTNGNTISPAAALAEAARAVPVPPAVAPVATPVPPAPVAVTPAAPAPVVARAPAPPRPAAPAEDWPHLDAKMRPVRRKGAGPLGLELRFRWGAQIVAEQLLGPQHKGDLKIGTAPGVDFIVGDQRLGGPSFTLISADGAGGFVLRITGQMTGELERKGRIVTLLQAIESNLVTREDDAYAIALEP